MVFLSLISLILCRLVCYTHTFHEKLSQTAGPAIQMSPPPTICTEIMNITLCIIPTRTGRLDSSVPRSKRLLTDDRSNVLIYMTGETTVM